MGPNKKYRFGPNVFILKIQQQIRFFLVSCLIEVIGLMGGGEAEITIFLAYPYYKSKGTVLRSILNMFWTKALITIVILVSHPLKSDF